jgi:putative ABC transport system substrate-binding protein
MALRRGLLIMLGVAMLALPVAAEAQTKVWRIGFLGVATPAVFERPIEALRLGLRDHGYVEGKNITIEFRWAEGRYDRLPALAEELVRLNPDVIITHGAPGTRALKQATSTIPIVMAAIGNPVEGGVVASLARPGGNITGSAFLSDELTAKRLDVLKAALPDLGRVGFLANLDNTATMATLRSFEQVAQALNIKVQRLEVRRPDQLDAVITLSRAQTDALLVPDEQLFSTGAMPGRIADLAMRNRLPRIGFTGYAEAGGLLDYGVDFPDLWRRSMSYVDRILKGAKPADLPVEQSSKFELGVNQKTAKALGVIIPPSVLVRADRVVE